MYNTPGFSEVAVIVLELKHREVGTRGIVLCKRYTINRNGNKESENNPIEQCVYTPLRSVLLYPYGRDGLYQRTIVEHAIDGTTIIRDRDGNQSQIEESVRLVASNNEKQPSETV